MKRILLFSLAAAVCLFAAAAISGVGRPGSASGADATGQPSLVTTAGHGTVTAVPDRATITAGVDIHAPTAAAALAQNAKAMNGVIAAVKGAGGTNLQTQQVSLSPQTDENGNVTGYDAQNSVSADAAIAAAGGLVDAAVGAGANTVSGPSLSVSDQDELYRNALKQAVVDARAKAGALADAGGFTVGPVFSVTENGTAPQPVFQPAAAKTADSTPVEPGTQDVTADVTVSFRIK